MDGQDQYRSIEGISEAEFKDNGSRFLAFAKNVKSESEFAEFRSNIVAQHHKARHFCFAYRLIDPVLERSSDDGEPSGTAGKPILNQLLSFELYNVAVIVVRYFGGTKLGTSGLIKAYKEATLSAVQAATIVDRQLTVLISANYSYAIMGTLMDTIKALDIIIHSNDFGESPKITLEIPRSLVDKTITQIKASMLNRSPRDIEEDTEVEGLVFLGEEPEE